MTDTMNEAQTKLDAEIAELQKEHSKLHLEILERRAAMLEIEHQIGALCKAKRELALAGVKP
jgi:predicted  nucleic acid-binding Zn-ribbon protein